MKRFLVSFITLLLIMSVPVHSQGRFIKNVAKDVKSDLLGSSGSNTKKTTQPEPPCACNNAEQILSLSQYKLEYSEITIDLLDDGSFLVFDRIAQNYYIINNGNKKGPYQEGDPAIAKYTGSADSDSDPLLQKYSDYITSQGDKFLIKFDGKTYGPYAKINYFAVTKSREKFAATVTENIAITEEEGEKMEAAMKNAKTDAERTELAMQYAQQMNQKMMAAGGAGGFSSKLITNIEGSSYNPMVTGYYNSDMKYDDIVYISMHDVLDLKGNKLITLKPQDLGNDKIFIRSDNSGYATYSSGTLNISDGKPLSDLFNPHLTRADGKIWLAYMYYSPSKNAIMQCKIAF